MKYLIRVPVTREVYITVEADSKSEASEKALQIMRDSEGSPVGYAVKGCYYHARQVEEIKE